MVAISYITWQSWHSHRNIFIYKTINLPRFTGVYRRFHVYNKIYCCISKLVPALWLVNLAVRTFLHGPLKPKVFLLPDCCVIYCQMFLTSIANKSFKLSVTLNCVLKSANDLKTISNWFVLLSTCFRNLKPFLMNGNCSWTLQTHKRDIINIL